MADGQLTATVAGSGHEPWAVVQGVQSFLDAVHTTTGLPWWTTLMLSGVTLRAAIFPFYVYQIKATQRLMQARPDFSKLYSAYKYARTFTPGSDHKGHIDAMLLGRQGVKAVMKKYNTRPIQTVVGSVAYIPLFFIMAYSARDMVRCGNFAGFDSGGLLFWKNLMETDSTKHDFARFVEIFRSQFHADELYLHTGESNATSFFQTYDGVDLGGERLADEIQQLAAKMPKLQKLSMIGHSLGGLYNRYCIGLLLNRGFFDKIEPMNFVTLATPHLGIRRPRRGATNVVFNALMPKIFSRTGAQLTLIDAASEETQTLSKSSKTHLDKDFHPALSNVNGSLLISLPTLESQDEAQEAFELYECELIGRMLRVYDNNEEKIKTNLKVEVDLSCADVKIFLPSGKSMGDGANFYSSFIGWGQNDDGEKPNEYGNFDIQIRWSSESMSQFMQALQLFKARTLYSSIFFDMQVPYTCAAVRAYNPYRLTAKEFVMSPIYTHIVLDSLKSARKLRDTIPLKVKRLAMKYMAPNHPALASPSSPEQEPHSSHNIEGSDVTDAEQDELRGMLLSVQSVGWRRIDVLFGGIMSHEHIIAKRANLDKPLDSGIDVVHHVMDTFML
ncbi:Cytochrome Oxidase Biogenesis (Oxa1) Family [Phytophthora palmivora]|uniref:Cytochrome Oxidase Biogenesis (Oxa1) Family n=1 Tax=Phytophthora palmivora TaxID=4796 RepID=A0A2P4X236_9STRA|nr:Cytochrome Oxidase Biogenesis (Oxa1) Family [Phytophthora palmivora]